MTAVDESSPQPPTNSTPAGKPARRPTIPPMVRRLVLALTVVGLFMLVAIAPLAHLAAARLPIPPNDAIAISQGTTRPGTTALRLLPVGLPTGIAIKSPQDVYPYAVAALGAPGAQALMGLVTPGYHDVEPSRNTNPASRDYYAYPYRYPALDPILANAPQAQLQHNATQLAAALIRLAGEPTADWANNNTAGEAAYAILDRARALNGCDAQLDLLLLVAADPYTSPEILADEYRRSAAACPNDPTPGWVVGQAQMRNVGSNVQPRPAHTDDGTRASMAAALATFQDLKRHFPNDTSVITGLGDAYLRAGLRLLYSDPFTARDDLRAAVGQYDQAAERGDAHDADLGRAHALIGLGDPGRAAQIAGRVVADTLRPGAALEVLLSAQEAAHHLDAAQEAAHRLEEAGPGSYPAPLAFFPRPTNFDRGMPFDASLPLSTGADTVAPLRDSLAPIGGAGGVVEDLSFIPQYRDSFFVTAIPPYCPSVAWRRDAIVAGKPAQALAGWPDDFVASRPGVSEEVFCNGPNDALRAIAQLAAQRPITPNEYLTADDVTDEWQNLLRWAGDLPAARQVISEWEAKAADNTATPALRLGEVAFLHGDFDDAAAQFAVAARRARLIKYGDDLSVYQAELDRGAALLKSGRAAEAVPLLRQLENNSIQGYALQDSRHAADAEAQFAAVSYHAAVQLADHESAIGDLRGAVDDYSLAASWISKLWGYGFRPEVVYNDLALAYLGIGATEPAQALEAKAIHVDPMDPVFLMSAGFIADRAGKTAMAADFDRHALHSDPGAFAAANDLGVELARGHDFASAEVALRQAVGAKPDYGLGWFNLGELESLRGPAHLLASQGAFAKAFTLDATLKDRRRELTIDDSVYRTGLDLSKPLPPRWSLAQTQKAGPAASAGVLAVALLAVGLARSSGQRAGQLAKQWLEPITQRLSAIRSPKWLLRPMWGVVATVVAFMLAYLRHIGSPTETVTYILGLVVMIAAAMYARIGIAMRGKLAVTQSAWLPGMAFGLVTGAVGSPWAPLPVTGVDAESNRVYLAAPLTLAALSLALFAEAAWSNVPLAQAFAVAALIMTGSTLLPVEPLDGAKLKKTGAVAAAGVLGGAVLIILGVV